MNTFHAPEIINVADLSVVNGPALPDLEPETAPPLPGYPDVDPGEQRPVEPVKPGYNPDPGESPAPCPDPSTCPMP